MYSSARSTALQILSRIVLGDCRLDQRLRASAGRRCDASQVGRDARDQVGRIGLGDDPAATAVVLVNDRGRNAHRLRDRADRRLRQAQARLDLPGELVAQIERASRR